MKHLHLKGIIPPILTPLQDDGSVDVTGLKNLTTHMIESGVHGIFAMGTAGEGPMLPRVQRTVALKTIKEASENKVPLLVGLLETSTARSLELLEEAELIGADAVVVNAPYYFSVSQKEIIKHCLTIKDSTELPVVLYNIPRYTGNPLHAASVYELAQLPGFIGYKDSSSNMVHFQDVLRLTKDLENFSVFQGNHLLSIPSLLMGADGIVPGIGNIIPQEMVLLYNAVLDGDLQTAYKYHDLVSELEKYVAGAEYSLSMLKAMVEILGFSGVSVPHYPLPPLADDEKHIVKDFFRSREIKGFKGYVR